MPSGESGWLELSGNATRETTENQAQSVLVRRENSGSWLMRVLRFRSLADRRLRCRFLLISEVQVAQINGKGNEVLYHSN